MTSILTESHKHNKPHTWTHPSKPLSESNLSGLPPSGKLMSMQMDVDPLISTSDIPLQYFASPLRTLIASTTDYDYDEFITHYDLIEAYTILSSRIRARRKDIQSNQLPSHVRTMFIENACELAECISRDIRGALRHLHEESVSDEDNAYQDNSLVESESDVIRHAFDPERVVDLYELAKYSFRLLMDLFLYPALHSAFTHDQLSSLFRHALHLATPSKPAYNSDNLTSWVMWMLATQSLPLAVLREETRNMVEAIKETLLVHHHPFEYEREEGNRNGIKIDAFKAIHALLKSHPSLSHPFVELLPIILDHLNHHDIDVRVHAAYALSGYAVAKMDYFSPSLPTSLSPHSSSILPTSTRSLPLLPPSLFPSNLLSLNENEKDEGAFPEKEVIEIILDYVDVQTSKRKTSSSSATPTLGGPIEMRLPALFKSAFSSSLPPPDASSAAQSTSIQALTLEKTIKFAFSLTSTLLYLTSSSVFTSPRLLKLVFGVLGQAGTHGWREVRRGQGEVWRVLVWCFQQLPVLPSSIGGGEKGGDDKEKGEEERRDTRDKAFRVVLQEVKNGLGMSLIQALLRSRSFALSHSMSPSPSPSVPSKSVMEKEREDLEVDTISKILEVTQALLNSRHDQRETRREATEILDALLSNMVSSPNAKNRKTGGLGARDKKRDDCESGKNGEKDESGCHSEDDSLPFTTTLIDGSLIVPPHGSTNNPSIFVPPYEALPLDQLKKELALSEDQIVRHWEKIAAVWVGVAQFWLGEVPRRDHEQADGREDSDQRLEDDEDVPTALIDNFQTLLLVHGQLTPNLGRDHLHLTATRGVAKGVAGVFNSLAIPSVNANIKSKADKTMEENESERDSVPMNLLMQTRHLKLLNRLWSVLKNVFTTEWLSLVAEVVLAGVVGREYDLSFDADLNAAGGEEGREERGLRARIKQLWTKLCTELVAVGVPTLLHVLHQRSASIDESHKESKEVLEYMSRRGREVTRGLWRVVARDGMTRGYATSAGASAGPVATATRKSRTSGRTPKSTKEHQNVLDHRTELDHQSLLHFLLMSFDIWVLSPQETEWWDELLSRAIDLARRKVGKKREEVVTGLIELFGEGKSDALEQSPKVLHRLFSYLVSTPCNTATLILLPVINRVLLTCYERVIDKMAYALEMLRCIAKVIERTELLGVLEMVTKVEDGVGKWLEDEQGLVSGDEHCELITSIYVPTLHKLTHLTPTIPLLQTLTPFLITAFARPTASSLDAFQGFWRATYHAAAARGEVDTSDYPFAIRACLKAIGDVLVSGIGIADDVSLNPESQELESFTVPDSQPPTPEKDTQYYLDQEFAGADDSVVGFSQDILQSQDVFQGPLQNDAGVFGESTFLRSILDSRDGFAGANSKRMADDELPSTPKRQRTRLGFMPRAGKERAWDRDADAEDVVQPLLPPASIRQGQGPGSTSAPVTRTSSHSFLPTRPRVQVSRSQPSPMRKRWRDDTPSWMDSEAKRQRCDDDSNVDGAEGAVERGRAGVGAGGVGALPSDDYDAWEQGAVEEEDLEALRDELAGHGGVDQPRRSGRRVESPAEDDDELSHSLGQLRRTRRRDRSQTAPELSTGQDSESVPIPAVNQPLRRHQSSLIDQRTHPSRTGAQPSASAQLEVLQRAYDIVTDMGVSQVDVKDIMHARRLANQINQRLDEQMCWKLGAEPDL